MDGIEVRRHLIGRGRVVEIVLDRPEALNALNTMMLGRVGQTCAELAPDTAVRAVVLTATGDRAFCVGADLRERRLMTDAQWLPQRAGFRNALGGTPPPPH